MKPIYVTKTPNLYRIQFEYHPKLVEVIKMIPSKPRYDGTDRAWLVSINDANELATVLFSAFCGAILSNAIEHKRCFFGDQPGLGKTLQAICAVVKAHKERLYTVNLFLYL